ncbi:hypothetical protein [Methylacidimicrobium cyclopophantes]|uniref:hypothetical protein n=1 Tax=Methylacidimicrobium cyclopophantes TaxID=1041766 RepID=UPI00115BBEA5|nr:hypothetical protein [Methylacidimicrobium cyclopophantes]
MGPHPQCVSLLPPCLAKPWQRLFVDSRQLKLPTARFRKPQTLMPLRIVKSSSNFLPQLVGQATSLRA